VCFRYNQSSIIFISLHHITTYSDRETGEKEVEKFSSFVIRIHVWLTLLLQLMVANGRHLFSEVEQCVSLNADKLTVSGSGTGIN